MSYFYRPALMKVSSLSYNGGADLILTDHGRSDLQLDIERIEKRERMASGRMRSKFVADKHKFSTSWEMLPSRNVIAGQNIVADGYSSAQDIMDFYDAVSGEFTLTLYADDDSGPTLTAGRQYGVFKVFFSSFSSSLTKRGKDFDFWEISLSLEES